MNKSEIYEYVVLRFSPDTMRGEFINIGLVIFSVSCAPIVRLTAPMAKILAIDPEWSKQKEAQLYKNLGSLLKSYESTPASIRLLSSFGYCLDGEPGFFYCKEGELDREIRELSEIYVSKRSGKEKTQRRSRLHKEVSDRFRKMDILGSNVDDLGKHRVVPHMPIPENPDLKGDFVYKNGVYRITQTLDYRVSPMAAHQKVSEACTKVMAASEAIKVWGGDTKKFALVCVPPEVASIADAHLDLLYASEFEIFHADDQRQLAKYHELAFSH